LDRLARSTCAVKQVGAEFRSLKDTWADTTTPHRQLMLTILGGLAEFERTLIRARTGEGRERAKSRGVRFGRPKKLSAHQRREALDRIAAGEAVAEVARTRDRPRDHVSSKAVSIDASAQLHKLDRPVALREVDRTQTTQSRWNYVGARNCD
jgi:DNA invertase Pin-like site-specific DNA recombinase